MNQYRHSKIQSLFDGDYFKYSVFFDSCNILCTDIFQRIPALEKHRKTASGSDRMHVDRRNLPEYGFPGGNPKFHLPESMSLNETILTTTIKIFLPVGKQNAVYRATVDFLPGSACHIHITFLDTCTAETLYELSASCYQPISLSTTGGMRMK